MYIVLWWLDDYERDHKYLSITIQGVNSGAANMVSTFVENWQLEITISNLEIMQSE